DVALTDHFLGQRLGQGDEGGLAGRVRAERRVPLLAGNRGDVDDAPITAAHHPGNDGPAEEPGADEVDTQDRFEVVAAQLPDSAGLAGDAGVVDQDVDAAGLLKPGHGGGDVGFRSDVAGGIQTVDLPGHRLSRLGGAIKDDHTR